MLDTPLDKFAAIIIMMAALLIIAVAIDRLRRRYSPTYRQQAEAQDRLRAEKEKLKKPRTEWEKEADRRAMADNITEILTWFNILTRKRK